MSSCIKDSMHLHFPAGGIGIRGSVRHDDISNERQQGLATLLLAFNVLAVFVWFVPVQILYHWNPGLTPTEVLLLCCLAGILAISLLLAAEIPQGIQRAWNRGLGPGELRSAADPFVQYRWLFYYIALTANILALALVVETTGGLGSSPFVALFVAFILIGQQLSRFETQSRRLILFGATLAGAMLLLKGYASKPEHLAPVGVTVFVVFLTLGFSGLLSWREKPPNPLVGSGRSALPTHAHVYHAYGAWHFVLYRHRHRLDPVVPGRTQGGRLKVAFQGSVKKMAAEAGWPALRLTWPKDALQREPASFRVAFEAAQDSPTYTFLDSPGPIAVAHRGGSAAGENGLSAFQAVEQLSYKYVETDVRTTRDGVPVIFHDADLSRMTGNPGAIREFKLREIKRLVLPDGGAIPTLAEALQAFPNLRFNIDLKDEASIEPVVAVLRQLDALNRVCVTSFSERRVRRARSLLDHRVCTGLGAWGSARVVVGSLLVRDRPALARGAAVLQLPFWWRGTRVVTKGVVKRAHDAGLAVHVWTLNYEPEIEKALDLGVDGVMTDQPKMLKEILVARGQWHEER
jgi:glycerophosphoryl diester phosphodiesterase